MEFKQKKKPASSDRTLNALANRLRVNAVPQRLLIKMIRTGEILLSRDILERLNKRMVLENAPPEILIGG
jgi:hypothetical protein